MRETALHLVKSSWLGYQPHLFLTHMETWTATLGQCHEDKGGRAWKAHSSCRGKGLNTWWLAIIKLFSLPIQEENIFSSFLWEEVSTWHTISESGMSSSAHPTSPGLRSGSFGLLVIKKTLRYSLYYNIFKLLMKLNFACLNCKGIILKSWLPNNTTVDVMSLKLSVRHVKRKPNVCKHTHAILRKNNPFVSIWWNRSRWRAMSSERLRSPPLCTSPLALEGQHWIACYFAWFSRCSRRFTAFTDFFWTLQKKNRILCF